MPQMRVLSKKHPCSQASSVFLAQVEVMPHILPLGAHEAWTKAQPLRYPVLRNPAIDLVTEYLKPVTGQSQHR